MKQIPEIPENIKIATIGNTTYVFKSLKVKSFIDESKIDIPDSGEVDITISQTFAKMTPTKHFLHELKSLNELNLTDCIIRKSDCNGSDIYNVNNYTFLYSISFNNYMYDGSDTDIGSAGIQISSGGGMYFSINDVYIVRPYPQDVSV